MGDGTISVAPPLASRVLMALDNAQCSYEEVCEVATTPFPVMYTQTSLWLMIIHTILTPIVVCTWVHRPSLAFILSFVTVFNFWALFAISEQMENPFGFDDCDIAVQSTQSFLNC